LSESIELSALVPLPPPPSLDRLIREMSSAIDDYELLVRRLLESEWRQFFANVSAEEYGKIVSSISNTFDQPRFAALLSPHVNNGSGLTCTYAASAVRNSTEWNRSAVARRLLPLCVNIATGYGLIRNELNEWDQTVTENDFQNAIRNAK
jgi:hypothetical protein